MNSSAWEGMAKKVGVAIGSVALVWVVGLAGYAIYRFSDAKSGLMQTGVDASTADLLAWGIMLIAIGLPFASAIRVFTLRAKPVDYTVLMVLPLISWAVSQMSGPFDVATGQARQFCALNPNGTYDQSTCRDFDGFAPDGRQLVAVEQGQIQDQNRAIAGDAPKLINKRLDQIAYFDAAYASSLVPIVWVAPSADGCFVPFDNPGRHPQTGQKLVPVNEDLIRMMRACLYEREQAKALAVRQESERQTAERAKQEAVERERLARTELAARQEAERRAAEKAKQAEAERELQARVEQVRKQQWADFESGLNLPIGHEWIRNANWQLYVQGKRVKLIYDEDRLPEALRLGQRLRSLGALVSHEYKASSKSLSYIRYGFDALESANVVQSIANDLAPLEMISSGDGQALIEVSLL